MPYTVPQIKGKAKIVGPLTARQTGFIGGAAAITIFLYLSNLPFFIFAILAIILIGAGLALAFLKVGGRSLPVVAQNFLTFSLRPKIYIWRRKKVSPKIVKTEPERKTEEKIIEEKGVLRVAGKSHLQKISSQIETRTH